MVLEYWIIGLILLQIVLGFGLARFQAELTRNSVLEMVEDLPPAIAEAFENATLEQIGGNFEPPNPIQAALAQVIMSNFETSIPGSRSELTKDATGKFMKKYE